MRFRGVATALVLLLAAGAIAADADSWQAWRKLGLRGDAAFQRKDFAAAEAAYGEAVSMAGRLGAPLALEANMGRLVVTWAAQGRCGPAAERQRAALTALAERGRAESREALGPHSLLTWLALAEGDFDGAMDHLQRVQALLEAEGGESPDLAPVLNLRAFLLRPRAPAEADALLERSQGLRRKPLRADPFDQAVSRLQQVWTAAPDEALRQWPGALAEAQRAVGERHPLLAPAWSAYASLLEAHKRSPAAARQARARAARLQARPLCAPR